MSGVKHCPLCGDNGFVKASTRRKPSGEWDARMKCEECGIELVCSGATEDDALTAVLVKWNARAERTCVPRVVPRSFSGDSEPSFYQAVCDCGWIVGEDGASSLSDFEHVDPYCGGCGAKVEKGESCAT